MLGIIGIIAVAITLVSKELILNFISNFVIIGRGLFQVGDRVQIENFMGDIMEIGAIYFTLAEIGIVDNEDIATGKVIKVPNSLVLTRPVVNFSKGRMITFSEILINLSINTNWKKAKEIGLEIIERNAYKLTNEDVVEIENEREELIFLHYEPSANIKLKDGKILLFLRYPCKFHKKREIEFAIWEELFEKFSKENDIEICD
jgi:small-conductance mechanosensitive channel